MKYAVALLAIALGVAAFIYGGYDDSPGLQLIGAVLVIATAAYAIRAGLRTRQPQRLREP